MNETETAVALARIEEQLIAMKDDYLEGIKEQVTRTNGRVTALENRAERAGVWVSVLWIIGGALFVFLGAAIGQHIFNDRVTDLQQIQQPAR